MSTTIETLVAERKLTSEGLDPNTVSAIREEMERAQARRLQPHFIGAFFREAFAPGWPYHRTRERAFRDHPRTSERSRNGIG